MELACPWPRRAVQLRGEFVGESAYFKLLDFKVGLSILDVNVAISLKAPQIDAP